MKKTTDIVTETEIRALAIERPDLAPFAATAIWCGPTSESWHRCAAAIIARRDANREGR